MRWVRALVLPVLAVTVIACSAPTPDTGNGNGSQESDTPQASTDDGGGDGGGGGGSQGDVEQLAEQLKPPNSTESSRFTTAEGISVGYGSTDSTDSLKSYYEGKFDDLGINLIGTSSASGSHTFVIGDEDGSGIQGGVSVIDDGSGGSIVSITIGFNQ
jgi:hypothetical protein